MAELEYIPIDTVRKFASTVVLATKPQVKKGREPKASNREWDVKPKDYTGFNDKKYPTGIICTEIPELKAHLVVIDLDSPKTEEDLPVKILKTYALPLIQRTYSNATPRGGVHIYLLSKTKPSAKQPRASHNVNIDYQANVRGKSGKYVAGNWIWSRDGKKKLNYRKMVESPDKVLLVDDADDLLNRLLSDLEEAGHIRNTKNSDIDEIIDILKPYYKEGTRQHLSCCISGYLKKQGYPINTTEEVIRAVFADDPSLKSERLPNMEQTYKKEDKDIKGWDFLKDYLSPKDQQKLSKITTSNVDYLKIRIEGILGKYKSPTALLLARYLEKHFMIFTDPYIHKHYIQDEDGSFNEIDKVDIMNFCNEEFGANRINIKLCDRVFEFFTVKIDKDWDLIEFSNGVLNTRTQEFFTDKRRLTKVPKHKLPIKWDANAPGLEIEEIVNSILDSDMHPDDKELWFKAVGHAFMGDNQIGKITIVTGPSVTTLIQRVLKTSQLPTSKITANERFILLGLVDKDVNIDDDIDNGEMKRIGNLNTVVTGNGLDIEMKGEGYIHLDNPQIPRLFANGNTLPTVIGEGWDRRLLLIHADNKIQYKDRRDTLQNDILLGKYDNKGLEWLVYKAITSYWAIQGKAITTERVEAEMKIEHELKSNPLGVAIDELYSDDYEDHGRIPTAEVSQDLKEWLKKSYRQKKISKEALRDMTKIRKKMEEAGFIQGNRYLTLDNGEKRSTSVYLNIRRRSEEEQETLRV
jgi:phage/plasmid-associated DNA primase